MQQCPHNWNLRRDLENHGEQALESKLEYILPLRNSIQLQLRLYYLSSSTTKQAGKPATSSNDKHLNNNAHYPNFPPI